MGRSLGPAGMCAGGKPSNEGAFQGNGGAAMRRGARGEPRAGAGEYMLFPPGRAPESMP